MEIKLSGHSFEIYILMEVKAYQAYRNPEPNIRYWRPSTAFEVLPWQDFLERLWTGELSL